MIVYYCITSFLSQVLFLTARTWNIKSIAEGKIYKAILSGVMVYVCWLISVSISVISANEIIKNFSIEYLPVILCSIIGGSLGTYIGMIKKKK